MGRPTPTSSPAPRRSARSPPYAVIGLAEIAGLVTDARADNRAVQQLSHQGVNIIQA
jgi:DeoR/GlpR family transcriptional regulator of sugar metabolism